MIFNHFCIKLLPALRAFALGVGFFSSSSLFSQSLSSRVEIEGEGDLYSFASVLFNGNLLLHAGSGTDFSESYFYKVKLDGAIDSILVRDFNDSVSYGFRYAFVKDDNIYWLGEYTMLHDQPTSYLGYALVVTDSNFQIIDRIIVSTLEDTPILDYYVDDDDIYFTLLLGYTPPWYLRLVKVNSSGSLSLIKDTTYYNAASRTTSFVKIDNSFIIPVQNTPFYHTVELSGLLYLGRDTLTPFAGGIYSPFGVNNLSYYQDSLLITSYHFTESFMLLDDNLNLLDTFRITNYMSGIYNGFHLRGADFVLGKNYYLGATVPAMAVANIPMQGDIRVIKIHDFSHEWDCLISDDSTNKVLTSMFPSDDGSIIYLVYNEYDHRKGNLERNVVVTTMDTMCNVLSTSKINIDDSFVQLFPNPATEGLNFVGPANDSYTLEFFSTTGQKKLSVSQVNNGAYIPLSGFASGLYLVKVKSEKYPGRERVLKVVVK
jgi:hypothetical protein